MSEETAYCAFRGRAFRLDESIPPSLMEISRPGAPVEPLAPPVPDIEVIKDDDEGDGVDHFCIHTLLDSVQDVRDVAASWLQVIPAHQYTQKARDDIDEYVQSTTMLLSRLEGDTIDMNNASLEVQKHILMYKELNQAIQPLLRGPLPDQGSSSHEEPIPESQPEPSKRRRMSSKTKDDNPNMSFNTNGNNVSMQCD